MNETADTTPEANGTGVAGADAELDLEPELEPRIPLYERRWFKPTVMVLGLVAVLFLMGLFFGPNYWRF